MSRCVTCCMQKKCYEKNCISDQDEDMDEVMNDPEFLQSVLEGLPGVDPQSEAIQSAMGQLAQQKQEKKESKKKDGKK